MTALDSSVSEAVPTQSVPPAGNLSHAAKVGQAAHKQVSVISYTFYCTYVDEWSVPL